MDPALAQSAVVDPTLVLPDLTMAPEKNLDERQKLQKLQARQTTIKIQAAKKKLTVVLAANPELWVKFWEDAQTLGYDVPTGGKKGTAGLNIPI